MHSLVLKQMSYPPTAGDREQPELPVTGLSPQELQHRPGISGLQPLLLSHAGTSRFAQAQIHRPTSPDVRSRSTEMTEDVRVRTTRLLKSIREDRQPAIVQGACRQVPLVIGSLGKSDDRDVVPDQDSG